MDTQGDQEKAQELLQRREAGILPVIDILGTSFIVDLRLRELREKDVPWNTIKIDDLDWDEETEGYAFVYDREEHAVVGLHEFSLIDPGNLVDMVLPHEIILDPYAVAREHDLDTLAFLKQYPIKSDLKAEMHYDKKRRLSESGRTVQPRQSQNSESEPREARRQQGRSR